MSLGRQEFPDAIHTAERYTGTTDLDTQLRALAVGLICKGVEQTSAPARAAP